jgi:hypothetical protein
LGEVIDWASGPAGGVGFQSDEARAAWGPAVSFVLRF